MSMPARLESHLTKHHVAYGRAFHPAIHGAQRTASVMHFPGKEVAKTIALRAGHKTFLSSDRGVEFAKRERIEHARRLEAVTFLETLHRLCDLPVVVGRE